MKKLKQQKIWICWKREPDGNGRMTKKPYSSYGYRTGTSRSHKAEWSTYETAKAAADDPARGFDGVGFILPKGYFFVDIDHQDSDSALVTDIRKILPTYMEISPSGNGMHLYGRCHAEKIPKSRRQDGSMKLDDRYYSKNSEIGVEIYIGGLTNRFATFTGNVVTFTGNVATSTGNVIPGENGHDGENAHDHILTECTQGLLSFLEQFMLRQPREKPVEIDPEDYEVLTEDDIPMILNSLRNAKNGQKFISLFDDGEIPDGRSPSEADTALCALIAFRAGPNPELINEIFRQSSLYRPKWDREDYWRRTVKAGIDACHGVFHHSVKTTPSFVYENTKGKMCVSAPKLAAHVKKKIRYLLVSEAKRGSYKKYVYQNGVYHLFSDDRFKGLIREAVESYDPTLVKMRDIDEAFKIINTDTRCIPITELNDNERYINFQNGLLDLKDMTLKEHDPSFYYTVQIGCRWKPYHIPTPVFDGYLDILTAGDPETQTLLLEFMGAVLSNVKGSRMKKALFMYGPGNTGKSQLKRLTEMLLGADNYSGIDLNQMEQRFGGGAIYGKRLTGTSDMGFMSVPELKLFKKATGGDTLFGEFKGQDGFEFVYGGLLWYCMNELPRFGGDDGQWVYQRIMQVSCNNVIPKEKQDPFLLDKLYEERAGIVYKLVMALKNLIANGYRFAEPQSVVNAREEYHSENNTVISFWKECMVLRSGTKIEDMCTTGRVFRVYKEWCRDNNHGFAKTMKEFRRDLSEYCGMEYSDMIVRHGKGGSFFREYTLSDEMKENYRSVYGYDDILPLVGE